MKNIFRSGSNLQAVIGSYRDSDEAALVLKSSSADGEWLCEFHGIKCPESEWFALSKSGEILATGSKSTVNHVLNNKGFRHDHHVANGRWVTPEKFTCAFPFLKK